MAFTSAYGISLNGSESLSAHRLCLRRRSRCAFYVCTASVNQLQRLRGRTAALRSKLSKRGAVIFDYVQAPHQLQPGDHVFVGEADTAGPKYTWWKQPDGKYDESTLISSIAAVRDAFATAQYDGLLGFSQGAAFIALLIKLYQLQHTNTSASSSLSSSRLSQLFLTDVSFLSSLDFVILISGFIPRDPVLRPLFTQDYPALSVPSLHVFGSGDDAVLSDESAQLVLCFDAATSRTFKHSGGHYVPSDAPARAQYEEFIKSFVEKTSDEQKL